MHFGPYPSNLNPALIVPHPGPYLFSSYSSPYSSTSSYSDSSLLSHSSLSDQNYLEPQKDWLHETGASYLLPKPEYGAPSDRDDPLEQFMSGKRQFLARSIDDVVSLIDERRGLSDRIMRQIDESYCAASSWLLQFQPWHFGQNSSIDRLRTQIGREMANFDREKRMEEVACWRDVARLRTELREAVREYAMEKRKDALLEEKP